MARTRTEAAVKNAAFNEAALPASLPVALVPPPAADAGAAAAAAVAGTKRGAGP